MAKFFQSAFTAGMIALSAVAVGCGATPELDDMDVEAASESETLGIAEDALVSCSGDSCNGLDPATTTCASNATTVETFPIIQHGNPSKVVGRAEIRFSNTCKTKWLRMTRTAALTTPIMKAYLTLYVSDSETEFLSAESTNTSMWTPMVYAPNKVYVPGDKYCVQFEGHILASSGFFPAQIPYPQCS